MIRRHFFLFSALVIVALMFVAVGFKLIVKGGGGGDQAAAAGPAAKGPAAKGGGGGAGGRGRALAVTPYTVSNRVFTDRLSVLGVAKGRESIVLTANTADIVDRVAFRPGDRVQRGQILVELRRTEEDANILQAQADVDVAKLNATRWQALADRGVAPVATAEQYKAAYDRARALLAAAESRRGDRVIRAPFSGVIGLTDVAAGALISPGTAIATLDDVSAIRVDFDIPDRYLPLVREGATILATVDAFPNQKYVGTIRRLDTRIDERTRALKARAEFPNPGGMLRPGMLVRVGIDRGQRNVLAIPETATQVSGDGSYVYVIQRRAGAGGGGGGGGAPGAGGGGPGGGGGGNLQAIQTPVLLGASDGGFVEVKEGLKAGDRVVADGLHRLQPGQGVFIAGRGGPGAQGAPGAGGRRPAGPAEKGAPAGKALDSNGVGAPTNTAGRRPDKAA